MIGERRRQAVAGRLAQTIDRSSVVAPRPSGPAPARRARLEVPLRRARMPKPPHRRSRPVRPPPRARGRRGSRRRASTRGVRASSGRRRAPSRTRLANSSVPVGAGVGRLHRLVAGAVERPVEVEALDAVPVALAAAVGEGAHDRAAGVEADQVEAARRLHHRVDQRAGARQVSRFLAMAVVDRVGQQEVRVVRHLGSSSSRRWRSARSSVGIVVEAAGQRSASPRCGAPRGRPPASRGPAAPPWPGAPAPWLKRMKSLSSDLSSSVMRSHRPSSGHTASASALNHAGSMSWSAAIRPRPRTPRRRRTGTPAPRGRPGSPATARPCRRTACPSPRRCDASPTIDERAPEGGARCRGSSGCCTTSASLPSRITWPHSQPNWNLLRESSMRPRDVGAHHHAVLDRGDHLLEASTRPARR